MGTDIHGRIQRRYTPTDTYTDVGEIEDGRNYRVFAMLAGVRNGTGFAGVYTHDAIEPISEPRGLPDDLGIKGTDYSQYDDESIEKPKAVDIPYSEYEFGEHSFSHVTLKEILDWPGWDKGLHRGGIVDRSEWERMEKAGEVKPREWCGDTWGNGVKIVSPTDARNRPDGDFTHVRVRWEEKFSDTCPTFYKWVQYLEAKYDYLLERDPGAVRLVFGFDS